MKAAELREQHKALLARPVLTDSQVFIVACVAGNQAFEFLHDGKQHTTPPPLPFLDRDRGRIIRPLQQFLEKQIAPADVLYRVACGGDFAAASPAMQAAFICFYETYVAMNKYARLDRAAVDSVNKQIAQAEARELQVKGSPVFKQLRALRDKISGRKKAREQRAAGLPASRKTKEKLTKQTKGEKHAKR